MSCIIAPRSHTCILLAILLGSSALSSPSLPNIVLIIVDDLGYADLSFTGIREDVHTPSIDRLALEGTRFANAYVTAPICNASRVGLVTGRYQQRQGVYWYAGEGLSRPEFLTMAEILKPRGYATGYIGKFHFGSNDHPKGRGFPLNHGFDRFFGFAGGTKHYLIHNREASTERDWLHRGPLWNQDEPLETEAFATELFGEKARQFIKENQEKPFFLTLSFSAVHNFTHQLPESYLRKRGLKGFPDLKDGQDYWEWRQGISYPNNEEGRDYYLGQLHFLDTEIGKVLDELDSRELADSTAIFLISDNGGSLVTYADNTPLRSGKYTLNEGGIRVPLITRLPEQTKPGTIEYAVVSSLDLLPTFCALANSEAPHGLDGRSLLPLLKEKGKRDNERTLFWDTGKEYAVRHGRWKLLTTRETPNPRLQISDTPAGTFLYDLSQDPVERKNLARSLPTQVEELQSLYLNWKNSLE